LSMRCGLAPPRTDLGQFLPDFRSVPGSLSQVIDLNANISSISVLSRGFKLFHDNLFQNRHQIGDQRQ
jgi:hypothetical protein